MRYPNRIEPFMEELGHIWKTQCPDWRFGQLMFNVQRVLQTHNTDIFYMEDDELLEYIRNWFGVDETQYNKLGDKVNGTIKITDGPKPTNVKNVKQFKMIMDLREEK